MDAIAPITFELVQAAAGAPAASAASAAGAPTVYEVARFEQLHRGSPSAEAAAALPAARSESFSSVLKTLQTLNGDVQSLGLEAARFAADRQELTPGDMLQLTVRCHQFMFQCELTANVANRSSEGVQQLFRQQS